MNRGFSNQRLRCLKCREHGGLLAASFLLEFIVLCDGARDGLCDGARDGACGGLWFEGGEESKERAKKAGRTGLLEGEECFGSGEGLLFLGEGEVETGEGVSDGFEILGLCAECLKGSLEEQGMEGWIDGGERSDVLELLMDRREGGEGDVLDEWGGILEGLEKLLIAQGVGGPSLETQSVGIGAQRRVRMAQLGVQKRGGQGIPKGGEPFGVGVAEVGE